MRAGVHVTKADDRAFGLQPRFADARRPVGLQHQAHRAGRHAVDQLIEQRLGLYAKLLGALHLTQAKLLLKPTDHPETAINHHLGVEVIGNRRRVWRNQRNGFQVITASGVDRRRSAIGQARRARLHATGAEHLTGLVGTRCNQRQAFRNPGMSAGSSRDVAEQFARLAQLRQLLATHRHGLPFPVTGLGPLQAFVVEWQISHATGQGIDKLAAQPMCEKPRKQQHLVRLGPDVRLVLGDPVNLGLGAKVIHRGLHPSDLEQPPPRPGDPPFDLGLTLVEP